MSNTPTRLATNSRIDAIHALKANSSEFALVLTEYDEVNDKIHRAETRLDAISEAAEAALRRRRLMLKDTIAAALSKT